jgi:hypothetical protein
VKQSVGGLRHYFRAAKQVLRLDSEASISNILAMNSMLIKVHSLLSDDGLPIYDSRVAGSAGALIELYCRATNVNRAGLSSKLVFPSTDEKRCISSHLRGCAVSDIIRYNSAGMATRWAAASVSLGRLLREVLVEQPSLFAEIEEQSKRIHALEATLFMIGSDIRSLRPAFDKYSKTKLA